jgi:hypothetical protein
MADKFRLIIDDEYYFYNETTKKWSNNIDHENIDEYIINNHMVYADMFLIINNEDKYTFLKIYKIKDKPDDSDECWNKIGTLKIPIIKGHDYGDSDDDDYYDEKYWYNLNKVKSHIRWFINKMMKQH